jgi:hypothetical protein
MPGCLAVESSVKMHIIDWLGGAHCLLKRLSRRMACNTKALMPQPIYKQFTVLNGF